MGKTKFKVTIVIPFFQNVENLKKCLNSIQSQKNIENNSKVSTIVVDNSYQHHHSLIEELGFDYDTIKVRPAIGFGRSANIGMEASRNRGAHYCLILNQDVTLRDNCLSHILDFLSETDGEVHFLSPLVKDMESKAIPEFHHLEYFGRGDTISDKPFQISNYQGCSILINLKNKECFFDPIFHMYYEDDDLFLRCLEQDYKIWILPYAQVYHANMGTLEVQSEKSTRLLWKLKSKIIFRLRHEWESKILKLLVKSWVVSVSTLDFRKVSFSLVQDFRILLNLSYLRNFSNEEINSRAKKQVLRDQEIPRNSI